MSKKKASPELIMEFAKTVCPESPDLFLSMGEKYIFLETIDRITRLEAQLAEAVKSELNQIISRLKGEAKKKDDEATLRPQNEAWLHGVAEGLKEAGDIVVFYRNRVINKENTISKKGTNSLMGVFVTANLRWEAGGRQGWVISEDPLRILGASGTEYDCDDDSPAIVLNPPKRCKEDER